MFLVATMKNYEQFQFYLEVFNDLSTHNDISLFSSTNYISSLSDIYMYVCVLFYIYKCVCFFFSSNKYCVLL